MPVNPKEVAQVRTKRSSKSTEITMETDELVSARRIAPSEASGVCPVCRQLVVMVTPEHAARMADVSTRTIYRWIEDAAVHFIETNGSLSICLHSLSLQIKGAKIPAARTAPRSEL